MNVPVHSPATRVEAGNVCGTLVYLIAPAPESLPEKTTSSVTATVTPVGIVTASEVAATSVTVSPS